MAKYEDHMEEEHYPNGHEVAGPQLCNSPSSWFMENLDMAAVCGNSMMQPPMAMPLSPAAKRKAASDFIQAATGVFVTFATDQGFRSCLRDGILLCRMANTVWPGSVGQYLEANDVEDSEEGQQLLREHNVTAFLNAAQEQLQGLPAECMFDSLELADMGEEEHPQVANCVLYIRSAVNAAQHPQPPMPVEQMPMTPPTAPRSSSSTGSRNHYTGTPPSHHSHGGVGGMHGMPSPARLSFTTPPPNSVLTPHGQHGPGSGYAVGYPTGTLIQQRSSPVHGMSSSPLMDAHSSLSHGGHSVSAHSHGGAHSTSLMPVRSSSMYGSSITAATHKSVQAAAGVTKLMQQCTNMLKERMFPMEPASSGGGSRYSPAGPDSAMKALGPVLEGVLGHLTEEYEKRLLAKDHDLSKMEHKKDKAEKEVERLKEELRQLREEADSVSAAVAQAAAERAEAEVARLEQQLADAEAALEAKDAELKAAQSMLDSADRSKADEMLRWQMECHRMRDELEGLQDLHERYKRVVEENRSLYNTVQDLRGNIRVFCRIRPPGATGDLSPCCVDVGVEGDLAIFDMQHSVKRVFKVDRVFDQNVTQEAVYEDTQPLIRSVLDGYNVCIFAYGQTGSGKTHTMSGTDTMHAAGRGINYRALDDLFNIRDNRSEEFTYTFRVQMLEIYNENLRDLLVDSRPSYHTGNQKLEILATQASGCNVPGATQVEVSDASDVAALMAKGASQRATSETKMNDRSSRSHQILTVIVDGVNEVTKARSHGCLHLIDLAGSERVGKSEASGDRLVEAQHINKSLSALGDVMAALAAKDKHIPYRNSKLTQLLQDSLQGQAKVMMFMHVSPEANMYGESVSTLKFASRVSEITLGQAKRNVVSGKVFEAHEEVLKQQRTMESKEQQLQQLQAALQHDKERHQREQQQLLQENEQLRHQLAEARAAAGTSDCSSSPARHPGLRLPIQQMLAAQAAEAEAAAAAAAATATKDAPAGSRSASSGGAHAAESSNAAAEAGGQTDSPLATGKPPRAPVDKTPFRDQDESMVSARSHATPEAAGCSYDLSSVEPTPRATPRSARKPGSTGVLPPRESLSSQKHLERLQSARQYGSYRPGSSNSPAHQAGGGSSSSSVAASGSLSYRHHHSEIPGMVNLKEQASKLTTGSSVRATVGGGIVSSRSSRDTSMPLTARVGSVVKSRVSEAPASSTMSMRQSGVYRPSSAAAGPAAGSGRVPSGPSTSRTGSRWK